MHEEQLFSIYSDSLFNGEKVGQLNLLPERLRNAWGNVALYVFTHKQNTSFVSAEQLYDAYVTHLFHGDPAPEFKNMPARLKKAWEAVALEVSKSLVLKPKSLPRRV